MSHVLIDSSNRFRNFASLLLEHEGALVEPLEPQGLEAMLPENLQRAIGAPEFLRLGFAAKLTLALPAMRQRILPGLFAAPLSEMRQGREVIRRFRELKLFELGYGPADLR
jgi:hypothetical protein